MKENLNEKIQKNRVERERGITLIALVVTIIVLLILAGVTIGTITGEDGIIKNALEAREKTEIANEKEIVEEAALNAMKNNKRGNIVKDELQEELDKITGEGKTIVTEDTEGQGYFVKFISSQRIYKVSLDGDVTYLGEETELISQAEIIANPESNTTPQLLQQVELTVQTQIDIEGAEYSLVYAWNQDKDNAPEDSKFMETTLTGTGRIRKTTVSSIDTVGGNYYLWVRVVVGEIEKTQCFGPYAIKDHTTLIATSGEGSSTSGFLGNTKIQRGKIESVNIVTSLSGHSLNDENCWDVSESKNGLYLAWYEDKDNDGYYEVTIGGEGGVVANSNSRNLFSYIGYGVENQEVSITGLNNLETGLTTNMSFMFIDCKASNLDVSLFNTENVTNMQNMFNNCSNITSLDLNSFDTSKVTNMSGLFSSCSVLSDLDITNFDTENVIDMGGMFQNCSKLQNLKLQNFDTTNVMNMQYMFQSCSSLNELDVSKFNTSNVKNMGGMFYKCSGLSNLNVSNFNTSNVTNMNVMFYGCSGLSNLDISNFETSNVVGTGIIGMFHNCTNITNIRLSTKFNTSKITRMDNLFQQCYSLEEVDVSHFDTSNVTNMNSVFRGCGSLTNLNVSNFNTSNVTNMEGMFYGCGFTQINLDNFNTEQVTNMNEMFAFNHNLVKLDLSKFETENVTNMEEMFWFCDNLEELDTSSLDTSKVTKMARMFNLCRKLTKLNLNKFDTTNVTDWTSMFGGVPTTIQIITNERTANWIREQFPEYTNITITN